MAKKEDVEADFKVSKETGQSGKFSKRITPETEIEQQRADQVLNITRSPRVKKESFYFF